MGVDAGCASGLGTIIDEDEFIAKFNMPTDEDGHIDDFQCQLEEILEKITPIVRIESTNGFNVGEYYLFCNLTHYGNTVTDIIKALHEFTLFLNYYNISINIKEIKETYFW
jgi:hypothetical protein